MKLASFSAKSTNCQIKQQAMNREHKASAELQMTPKDKDDSYDEDYDQSSRNDQSTTANWKTTPLPVDDEFEIEQQNGADVLTLRSSTYSVKPRHMCVEVADQNHIMDGGSEARSNNPTCHGSTSQDVFARPALHFPNRSEPLSPFDQAEDGLGALSSPALWKSFSPTPLVPLEDRLETGASLLCISTTASQDFSSSALEQSLTDLAPSTTALDEKPSAEKMPEWEKNKGTSEEKQPGVYLAHQSPYPPPKQGQMNMCSGGRVPLLPDIRGEVLQEGESNMESDPAARVDDSNIPSSYDLRKMLMYELAQPEPGDDLTMCAQSVAGEWIEVRIVDSMIDYELDADDVEQVFSSLTNVKKVTIEDKDKSVALVEVEEGQGEDIVALLDGHQLQDMNGKLSLRLLQGTFGGNPARNNINGTEFQSMDALAPAIVPTSRQMEKMESVDLLRFLSETAAEVGGKLSTCEGNCQLPNGSADSRIERRRGEGRLGEVFGLNSDSSLFGEVLNEKFNSGEKSYADVFEELWLEARKGTATAPESRAAIDRKNYNHGAPTGNTFLQQRHSVAADCGVARNLREMEPLGYTPRYSNSNLLDDLENLHSHLRPSKSAITSDISELLLQRDRSAYSNNDRVGFDIHRGSSPIDFSWNGGGLTSPDTLGNSSRAAGDFASPSARQKQLNFVKTTVGPGTRKADSGRGSSGRIRAGLDRSPFGVHYESPAQDGNKLRTNLSEVSTANRTDRQASFASPLDAYSVAMAAVCDGDSSTFSSAPNYCFDSPDGSMHLFSHPIQDCEGFARTPFQLEPSETGSHENYNSTAISPNGGGTYSFHPHASPANVNQSRVRKWTARYDIQIPTDNNFQVTRRIIGTRGANMKRINQVTGAKLRLRGRGSGYLEGSSRLEADDPLHLCISCCDYSKYKAAKQMVDKLLRQIYQDYDLWSKEICTPQPHLAVKVREVFLPNRDGADLLPSQQTPIASPDVKFTCLNY